jgi:hypothetical protein
MTDDQFKEMMAEMRRTNFLLSRILGDDDPGKQVSLIDLYVELGQITSAVGSVESEVSQVTNAVRNIEKMD